MSKRGRGRPRTKPYCAVCNKVITKDGIVVDGITMHAKCYDGDKSKAQPLAIPTIERKLAAEATEDPEPEKAEGKPEPKAEDKPEEKAEPQKAVSEVGMQEWVQNVGRATLGRKVYLNGVKGKFYWSEYDEDDERDDPEGKIFETPAKALRSIIDAVDFLIHPETGDFLLTVVR